MRDRNKVGPITVTLTAFALMANVATAARTGGVTIINQSELPYVINASGSYRLTSDLTVGSSSQTPIKVNVGSVTIDLNGFTINGGAIGIDAANQPLITIYNGQVSSMQSWGIVTGHSSRVERVRVFANGGGGVLCTDGCEILNNIVNNNGGAGIALQDSAGNGRGVISGNVSQYNSGKGIFVETAAIITGNSVNNNNDIGIDCVNKLGGYSGNVLNANAAAPFGCVSLGPNLCSGALCP